MLTKMLLGLPSIPFVPKSPLFDGFNTLLQDIIESNTMDAAREVKDTIASVFFVNPNFFYDRPKILLAWQVCRGAALSLVIMIILFWAIRLMFRAAFPDTPNAMQFIPRVFIGSFLIWKSDWIVATVFNLFRALFDTILSFFGGLSITDMFDAISVDIPLLSVIIYLVAIIIGIIFIFQCLIRIVASTVTFVTSPFAFVAWINPSSKPLYDGWIKFSSAVVFSWILNLIVMIIIIALNVGNENKFLGSDFLNSLLACAGLYFLTKTNKYCQDFVGAWGTYTNFRQGATNLVHMARYIPIGK